MRNKYILNKSILDDNILAFYITPYISTFAIISILSGESLWGPYKEGLNSIQVRIIGLFALYFCIYVMYNILIKWPRFKGGVKYAKKILKIFFKSKFFILWILSLIIYCNYQIYNIIYLKLLYFLIMCLCTYYQYKFIKTIKSMLD